MEKVGLFNFNPNPGNPVKKEYSEGTKPGLLLRTFSGIGNIKKNKNVCELNTYSDTGPRPSCTH
jgi:hypothetical protein